MAARLPAPLWRAPASLQPHHTPPPPPPPPRSINLIVLILFWSGASSERVLAAGNIPAHLLWPFLVVHACLYHIPVPPYGFISSLVTGAIYLLVTGVYTLGNGGVGPYEPESEILNWQTGLTASAVFIGLAIILVAHVIAYLLSAATGPLVAPAAPPAAPPAAQPLAPDAVLIN